MKSCSYLFMNILFERIYGMRVNLPKIVTSDNSGAATKDQLLFAIKLEFIHGMFHLNSITIGLLNQVFNDSRPSSELSDDNEPDVQQILIAEAL